METLTERIEKADSLLAAYAVPHQGTLGRDSVEPEDGTRFRFQRDRDRIIHTQAFRRLQGKTQVFVAGEGDHFRTRLTHTMEVAQVGRDIARTLSLNEDLSECIALAHDLGHPPFGHRGEQTLNEWCSSHGISFEHNEQSVRIVTLLEFHSPLAQGLNLNREVLEGMQKHREAYVEASIPFPRSMSLEAQVINKADEIAYLGHDCDDGIRAGLFPLGDLLAIPLVRAAATLAEARGTSLRGGVIHLLVTDLYEETTRLLHGSGIRHLSDVYRSSSPLVDFSPSMQEGIGELRRFLFTRMYEHPRVTEVSAEGQAAIRALCERYFASPPEKILQLKDLTGGTLAQSVKDYVAGMTDAFAKSQL